MQHFHTWEADGKRYKALFDDDYQTERSCGGSASRGCVGGHGKGGGLSSDIMPDEELGQEVKDHYRKDDEPGTVTEITQAMECDYWFQHEIAKLDRGEWVALGVVVEEPCRGINLSISSHEDYRHCECCSSWKETESVWGIVVESTTKAIEKFVAEGGL